MTKITNLLRTIQMMNHSNMTSEEIRQIADGDFDKALALMSMFSDIEPDDYEFISSENLPTDYLDN